MDVNKKTKQRRYYKKDEIVWIVALKREGKVKFIDKDNLTMTVVYKDDDGKENEYTGKLWLFDKIKYKALEKLHKKEKLDFGAIITYGSINITAPQLYFAKIRPDAIIPSKRDEDAGYDIYANLEPKETEEGTVYEMFLPKHQVSVIPTGIASYMSSDFFLDLKHERSSVGKLGVSVLAGCIDSTYQGEILVMVVPLVKDVLITSTVDKVEDLGHVILYPYKKAIAQAILLPVTKVKVNEITYEELKNKPSVRGTGREGSSGK